MLLPSSPNANANDHPGCGEPEAELWRTTNDMARSHPAPLSAAASSCDPSSDATPAARIKVDDRHEPRQVSQQKHGVSPVRASCQSLPVPTPMRPMPTIVLGTAKATTQRTSAATPTRRLALARA